MRTSGIIASWWRGFLTSRRTWRTRGVGLVLRTYPDHSLLKFCREVRPAIVIGDENPMREPERWRAKVANQLRLPFWTVDADVIVPSKLLLKEQFAARTIRPRLHALLPQFLVPRTILKARVPWNSPPRLRSLSPQEDPIANWKLDTSARPVPGWKGGSKQASRALQEFVDHRLADYPDARNRPEEYGTSQLSPYLHFGHIGPLTIARAVQLSSAPVRAKEAFLEQVIVRRELAINFVRFNPDYDSMECLEPWARRSLSEHVGDKRTVAYNRNRWNRADPRSALERSPEADGALGLDAQLSAHVLGEEDSGVESLRGRSRPAAVD